MLIRLSLHTTQVAHHTGAHPDISKFNIQTHNLTDLLLLSEAFFDE